MATLNKALTRPAAIGYSLVPFVLVSGAIVLLAVYVSYYLAITAYSCMAEMKNKTRKDIHYFSLLWLAFKTRGRLFTNTHFGANALLANQL
jgi:type IV secretion system protein VirB4